MPKQTILMYVSCAFHVIITEPSYQTGATRITRPGIYERKFGRIRMPVKCFRVPKGVAKWGLDSSGMK